MNNKKIIEGKSQLTMIEELNEYRLMTVDYYEFPILISRIFLSFSKDISIAEHTMNSYIKKIL